MWQPVFEKQTIQAVELVLVRRSKAGYRILLRWGVPLQMGVFRRVMLIAPVDGVTRRSQSCLGCTVLGLVLWIQRIGRGWNQDVPLTFCYHEKQGMSSLRFILIKTNTFSINSIFDLKMARKVEIWFFFGCCKGCWGQHCVAGPSEEEMSTLSVVDSLWARNLSYRLLLKDDDERRKEWLDYFFYWDWTARPCPLDHCCCCVC